MAKFNRDTRCGLTHKFVIHDPKESCEGFIVANYEQETGAFEVFIHMDYSDESLRGMARSLCLIVSVAVQNNAPLSIIVDKLKHQRYSPSGCTEHPQIQITSSLSDYIAKWIDLNFLKQGVKL